MSCNHANLNIHTTHSTNIDRKTQNTKKKEKKKTKGKENEKLLRTESVCILRSQVNIDIS